MKRIKSLSLRTQIFIASLFVVMLPNIALGIFMSSSTAKQINEQYQYSLNTILNQASMNLDTLLADVERLGGLHLVNDDVRNVLMTDYSRDAIRYARDSTMMRTQITQANRLNTNVVSTIFLNRYGYYFEYNVVTYRDLEAMLEKIPNWTELARNGERNTYFGLIENPGTSGVYQKPILFMVKPLYDSYSNTEIGVFYVGISFDAVADILKSSNLTNSKMVVLGQDGTVLFSASQFSTEIEQESAFIRELEAVGRTVDKSNPTASRRIVLENTEYTVSATYNKTTSWKIVSVMDHTLITGAYHQNIWKYAGVFALNIISGLLLAFFLSWELTRSISLVCLEIDSCESGDLRSIGMTHRPSNRELRKLIDSYNKLNQRLTESMKQNYSIRLEEKQTRLRMLQAQVNPHFFYNTLNLISSIANIYNVGQIKIIAESMSDFLRYNLKAGPIVQLRDEFKQIQQYIAIHEIRFPGRFQFESDIPPEFMDIEIPPFLLQPIVENSIVHGLEEMEQNAQISICAYCEGEVLHLLVSDNGKGIPAEKLKELRRSLNIETHHDASKNNTNFIGIFNVHQRIRTHYGPTYGLWLDSIEGHGTIVDIKLPRDRNISTSQI